MRLYIVANVNDKTPDNYIKITLDSLQNIPDSVADEIYCPIFDWINGQEQFLALLVKKLKYGGKLTITGTDISMVCDGVMYGRLQIIEAKQFLYNGRAQTNTLMETQSLFVKYGLIVGTIEYENFSYKIEGNR
jgi:hypothetical protein